MGLISRVSSRTYRKVRKWEVVTVTTTSSLQKIARSIHNIIVSETRSGHDGWWLAELLRDAVDYFGGQTGVHDSVNNKQIDHPNAYRIVDQIGERKMRVNKISLDDLMQSRGLLDYEQRRSYCMHHALNMFKCQRNNYRYKWNCSHEIHEYDSCMNKELYLRKLEFERLKRLNQLGLVPWARNETPDV